MTSYPTIDTACKLNVLEELASTDWSYATVKTTGEKFLEKLIDLFSGRGISIKINSFLRTQGEIKFTVNVGKKNDKLKFSSIPPGADVLKKDFLLEKSDNEYGKISLIYKDEESPYLSDAETIKPFVLLLTSVLSNLQLAQESRLTTSYLNTLFNKSTSPLVVVNSKRQIIRTNIAFEKLTGISDSEILGQDFLSIIPEDERVRMLPAILSAVQGKSTSDLEIRLLKKTGDGESTVHIAFNTGAVKTSSGRIKVIILVGQDLTEIRKLQSLVIHSEKLATLGQVAAGVAHELNNPLTSIAIYSEYLQKKLENVIDEADLIRLGRINKSTQKIQSFTHDLVSYARPSSEEPSMIDIREIIIHSISFCEHHLVSNEAKIKKDIADCLPMLYGIAGQLEQVFVSLIANACNSLPNDGGTITIKVAMKDEEKMMVSVSDTGKGIEPENLNKIFEPFFSTSAPGEGTGLGLSIVRNIMVNHNTDIHVKSKLGDGTTFYFYLYI